MRLRLLFWFLKFFSAYSSCRCHLLTFQHTKKNIRNDENEVFVFVTSICTYEPKKKRIVALYFSNKEVEDCHKCACDSWTCSQGYGHLCTQSSVPPKTYSNSKHTFFNFLFTNRFNRNISYECSYCLQMAFKANHSLINNNRQFINL